MMSMDKPKLVKPVIRRQEIKKIIEMNEMIVRTNCEILRLMTQPHQYLKDRLKGE